MIHPFVSKCIPDLIKLYGVYKLILWLHAQKEASAKKLACGQWEACIRSDDMIPTNTTIMSRRNNNNHKALQYMMMIKSVENGSSTRWRIRTVNAYSARWNLKFIADKRPSTSHVPTKMESKENEFRTVLSFSIFTWTTCNQVADNPWFF